MATPKRLNFSDTKLASLHKSPSTHTSEEVSKKKKLASPAIKRIWNEDDELSILKELVDYRVKTRDDPSFDWDGFFEFVKGSIHVRFSKEQLFSKVRKLRRKYALHMERIHRGDDPLFTRLTDSQAFGYSNMIWGVNQPQVAANGAMEKAQAETQVGTEREETQGGIERPQEETQGGTEKAREETQGSIEKPREETQSFEDEPIDKAGHVNDNGAESSKFDAKLLGDKTMEYMNAGKESEFANGVKEKATQIDSEEDGFRENGLVGNNEPVKENGAENSEVDGKSLHEVGVDKTNDCNKTDGIESHDDDDEIRVVEDAFETTILQGLSGWQRKLHLKKLMMSLETGKRKELSYEWKALCSEEVKLKIKKLRFAAKLVKAANDG